MELANLLIHMVFFGSYYGRLWSSWSCIRFDIYVLPLAESILPLWDNFALWNCCLYRCQSAYWILRASFLTLLWHSPGNVAGKTSFLPSAFSAIIKFELWVLPKIFWPWECMLCSILKIFFFLENGDRIHFSKGFVQYKRYIVYTEVKKPEGRHILRS